MATDFPPPQAVVFATANVDGASTASSGAAISLRHIAFALPSGHQLFEDLDATFLTERTGLVGGNGVGKSVLARMLADIVTPDAGRIVRQGSIAYVPQELRPASGATLASVAGLAPLFAALQRMNDGDVRAEDLDTLDGRWQARAEFEQALADCGMGRFNPEDPAAGLSGGELMRVALAGAFLSQADNLVLDEPSNHLDRDGRQWLRERLLQWRGGAIIVSHDRELLDAMDRIVELDAGGLHSYGGNYTLYRAQHDNQAAAAEATLEHARSERSATLRDMQMQHDANLSRSARNTRAGKEANIAPISRGRQQRKAEVSAGRETVRQAEVRSALDDAVREAAARVADVRAVALMLPATEVAACKRVLDLDQAVAPYPANCVPLDLALAGPVRLAITGPNGCGKTTLLKMFAGLLPPLSGQCQALVPHAWLDQHASQLLPVGLTVLERLHELETQLPDGVLRSHLALLGLQAAQVATRTGNLSGGERLKAALACALWQRQPAQMLLLDEPTNHLDLASVRALEQALQAYPGALVVASHDARFLDALDLSHMLQWHPEGWRLELVSA